MIRRTHRAAAILAVGCLALAACGGDDDDAATATEPPASEVLDTDPPPTETTAAPTATPAPTDAPAATEPPAPTEAPTDEVATTDPAGAAPLVELADSDLGPIIVAADGLTLYMFDPDAAGEPTCTGACAGTWPPYYVEDGTELTAGDGLDPALLSVVAHPDGGDMLKYGDWPLYYYAGDQAPGDTNGQGVNDVWFVVDGSGAPIQNAGLTSDEPAAGFYDY